MAGISARAGLIVVGVRPKVGVRLHVEVGLGMGVSDEEER